MKVAVDIRPALSKATGVGIFVENLVINLTRFQENTWALFSSSLKERLPEEPWSGLEAKLHDLRIPVQMLNFCWHRLQWPPIDLFTGKTDIAFSATPLIVPGRGKSVITLHDLYFLEEPQDTVAEIRRDYVNLVQKHSRKADAIISVSQATREKAIELLGVEPDKVTVCYEDCAPLFDQEPEEKELKEVEQKYTSRFFLFVGTIEPRKNLPALLKAFDKLAEQDSEVRLVIAGHIGWKAELFNKTLESLRHKARVSITGYCSREMLRALYHRATALIMPSHCEGFGIPLVEAMACGCPIITRDTSAMPEVAGDAALYWSGNKPEELSELMQKLLNDDTLRRELIARGRNRRGEFSWAKTAQIINQVFKRLVPDAR